MNLGIGVVGVVKTGQGNEILQTTCSSGEWFCFGGTTYNEVVQFDPGLASSIELGLRYKYFGIGISGEGYAFDGKPFFGANALIKVFIPWTHNP